MIVAANSLFLYGVVQANAIKAEGLRAVIEKLDVRRAQVFIEALIVELSADRAGEPVEEQQAAFAFGDEADAADPRVH